MDMKQRLELLTEIQAKDPIVDVQLQNPLYEALEMDSMTIEEIQSELPGVNLYSHSLRSLKYIILSMTLAEHLNQTKEDE